jgi:hypothetical protein
MAKRFGKRVMSGILLFGVCSCQTKTADNPTEIQEIATLRYNDSIQQDSIRHLSLRISHLEEMTTKSLSANNKVGATSKNILVSNNMNVHAPVAKTFALQDTMHVSNHAVVLSNICRWYFKGVEETKDSVGKGHRDCNFHAARDIVYLGSADYVQVVCLSEKNWDSNSVCIQIFSKVKPSC